MQQFSEKWLIDIKHMYENYNPLLIQIKFNQQWVEKIVLRG